MEEPAATARCLEAQYIFDGIHGHQQGYLQYHPSLATTTRHPTPAPLPKLATMHRREQETQQATTQNPTPKHTSNPLLAGSDMHALASSASSLSNTGEPSPAGTFLATHSTTPPIESPVFLISSILLIMRSAASSSGHRTMFASTCVLLSGSV